MKLQKVLTLLCMVCLLALVACKSAPKEEPPAPTPTIEEPKKQEPKPDPKPEPKPEPPKTNYAGANAQLLAGTEAARSEAEKADARKYYSEKFGALDDEFNKLKKEMEANPDADYSAHLKDLTSRYNALAKAARARAMKDKIDELNLSSHDQANYDAGKKALEEFDALGNDATGDAMLSKANVAFDSFTAVFSKAFKSLCATERKAALEAKKNADSVKAGVSQKDAYKNASEMFKKADSDFVTLNIEGAYKGYTDSKVAFTELFEKVSEARKAAQEAIERAKAKAKEAEDYTIEADEIAPLGNDEVKGIEAEDAKLLEDDTFEAAENAEINVEEGTTAKTAAAAAEVLDGVIDGSEKKADEITKELKDALKIRAEDAK